MNTKKIAFVGAGNMSSALIAGLVAEGFPAENIWASDIDDKKLEALESQCGIHTSFDSKSIISAVDIVVLSVKPQVMKTVCSEIAEQVNACKPLVVSIAAGINVENLSSWLGNKTSIVRAMPNTPSLIRTGAAGLFANEQVSAEQKDLAEKIMRAVGVVLWVDEQQQMDVVTALSGSGPAYFFKVMESLEQSAIELGLPANTAHLLTLQTALGAAKLALESSDSLATLREKVTSPGGTTEKGLEALQQGEIDSTMKNALTAASERAVSLAREYGE